MHERGPLLGSYVLLLWGCCKRMQLSPHECHSTHATGQHHRMLTLLVRVVCALCIDACLRHPVRPAPRTGGVDVTNVTRLYNTSINAVGQTG